MSADSSPTPGGSGCPNCGNTLPVFRNIYEYDRGPPYNKRVVRKEPARNTYAPFCSLRCGWAYGVQQYEMKSRKKK